MLVKKPSKTSEKRGISAEGDEFESQSSGDEEGPIKGAKNTDQLKIENGIRSSK